MATFKISENSWHFRLLKRVYPKKTKEFLYFKRTGLCEYFWAVVIHSAIFVVGLAVQLLMIGMFGYVMVVLPILYFVTGEEAGLAIMILEAIVATTGVVIAGVLYYMSNIKEKQKPKQDSLFVAYIKAKKEKFCPMVEFEKEKKL